MLPAKHQNFIKSPLDGFVKEYVFIGLLQIGFNGFYQIVFLPNKEYCKAIFTAVEPFLMCINLHALILQLNNLILTNLISFMDDDVIKEINV